MNTLQNLRSGLQKLQNKEKATILARFFKTGKGEYGEGDIFLGITVPEQRAIAKKYLTLSFKDLETLLSSKIHEERLIALLILVDRYKKGREKEKNEIFNFYLHHTKYVNNWDLVDLSAHHIVGAHLMNKEYSILRRLALSKNVWERRIAVVATFFFIRSDLFEATFEITRILLADANDLIHKASGWMLREVGKRDQQMLESFLHKHYKKMPRTMLRYAIERLDKKKRSFFLKR